MHIQHRFTTPYHPRGNGVVENSVKSACNMIRKLVDENTNEWDRRLPFIQLAMNTRVVHLHNSTPFSLFFARKANGLCNYTDDKGYIISQEELLNRLQYMSEVVSPAVEEKSKETQAKMIKRFNATVLHNEFPDGARVMTLDPIKGNKLTPRYERPYTVVRGTTNGAYGLRDGTGELLGRHYAPSQLKLVLDDFDETETYEVKEITDHKMDDHDPDKILYRVKWKNYPDPKWDTWEPESSFIERQCLQDYWEQRNHKPTEVSTITHTAERRGQSGDANNETPSRGTKRKRAH
jgi:hypothetical protein